MYVGSTETEELPSWVLRFTEAGELRLERETVNVSPALYKVYDEVITNALDASVKDASVKSIKINITPTEICCKNDGEGIPVEIHPEFPGTYVPTLVFGHLLTSTNYDDTEEGAAAVAGTNGLGVKLANIFSSRFSISVADAKTGMTLEQAGETPGPLSLRVFALRVFALPGGMRMRRDGG
jgi:DNA topoisomerase-2